MTFALWIFIAIQMTMGALDTLYHHEMTERLAWRKTQTKELKLHAIRNAAYAVVFTILALFQPGGWIAIGLILLLIAEVGVTLRDFAEEDLTRKLPVVVLALLFPVLLGWSQAPTALFPVWYGLWSLFLLAGALAMLHRDFRA